MTTWEVTHVAPLAGWQQWSLHYLLSWGTWGPLLPVHRSKLRKSNFQCSRKRYSHPRWNNCEAALSLEVKEGIEHSDSGFCSCMTDTSIVFNLSSLFLSEVHFETLLTNLHFSTYNSDHSFYDLLGVLPHSDIPFSIFCCIIPFEMFDVLFSGCLGFFLIVV